MLPGEFIEHFDDESTKREIINYPINEYRAINAGHE